MTDETEVTDEAVVTNEAAVTDELYESVDDISDKVCLFQLTILV